VRPISNVFFLHSFVENDHYSKQCLFKKAFLNKHQQPGILLATQDQNKVKSKHVLESEIKMYQGLNGLRLIKRWLRLAGHFCFINKKSKYFRNYQNSLNIFFVCYQRRLLQRDFLEAVVES
jgi:hypothetical protein